MNFSEICVSFVHGYNDLDLLIPGEARPALWQITPDKEKIHRYPFPRNPSDFLHQADLIQGPPPMKGVQDFKKLPRFGFTGLAHHKGCYYAASFNGIYEIDDTSFALNKIISNQMMSDPHGIWADDQGLISVLTGKDTVVFTDFEGNILDHFTVLPDLTITKQPETEDIDWRFVTKQFRGSCGYWHFNYVQRVNDEIWLTSRSASCFVAVNLKKKTARLRLMNACTPILLHDGVAHDGAFYFTSIDGKILITRPWVEGLNTGREAVDEPTIFHRDLVVQLIRLEETEFGREPNWCRGLAVNGNTIFVTVDGRYGSDLSFGLAGLTEQGEQVFDRRLAWKDIDDESLLRFVTGFDIHIKP